MDNVRRAASGLYPVGTPFKRLNILTVSKSQLRGHIWIGANRYQVLDTGGQSMLSFSNIMVFMSCTRFEAEGFLVMYLGYA